MNLDRLTAQLELTKSFMDRQALAVELAGQLQPEELSRITRLLGHEDETVRLGTIEILRAARFRPALKFLAAVTLQKAGDERAFAARAVTELQDPQDPADRKLVTPLLARWQAMDDEFVRVQADALERALSTQPDQPDQLARTDQPNPTSPEDHAAQGTVSAVSAESAASAASAKHEAAGNEPIQGITSPDRDVRKRAIERTVGLLDAPEHALADALLGTHNKGARVDLVQALERLGGARLNRVLEPLLRGADGDVAALVLRALRRVLTQLTPEDMAPMHALLESTRPRFVGHELARAAMDDCLVAVRPDSELEPSVRGADRIAPEAAYQLGQRLLGLSDIERLAHMQNLIPALERAPRRALLFAALLEWAWPHFRPSRRDRVRAILDQAVAKKLPDGLPATAVAAMGRLYAAAQRPGGPVPDHMIDALDQHHSEDTALAAIALYKAAATVQAARRLAEYLSDTDEAVRQAARQALDAIDDQRSR